MHQRHYFIIANRYVNKEMRKYQYNSWTSRVV